MKVWNGSETRLDSSLRKVLILRIGTTGMFWVVLEATSARVTRTGKNENWARSGSLSFPITLDVSAARALVLSICCRAASAILLRCQPYIQCLQSMHNTSLSPTPTRSISHLLLPCLKMKCFVVLYPFELRAIMDTSSNSCQSSSLQTLSGSDPSCNALMARATRCSSVALTSPLSSDRKFALAKFSRWI